MREKFRVALRAAAAAVTSPEVVKPGRKIVVFVVVRVLLALGASASLVEFVQSLAG